MYIFSVVRLKRGKFGELYIVIYMGMHSFATLYTAQKLVISRTKQQTYHGTKQCVVAVTYLMSGYYVIFSLLVNFRQNFCANSNGSFHAASEKIDEKLF